MSFTYKHTRIGCYINFLCNAVNNVFLGLLFTSFTQEFGIGIGKLAVISGIVFGVQAFIIPASSLLAPKIGFRPLAVMVQIFDCVGIAGIGIFPYIFDIPFYGLILAAVLYSFGNGICEGINNAMLESLPLENKDAEMSRLHSVFSWGQVFVILTSTLFFTTIGRSNWKFLAMGYALIPLINLFIFLKAPIGQLCDETERTPLLSVIRQKMFIFLMIIMVCNGPLEMCMAQWTSLFAEQGLHVSKTVGDLLGPCMFAAGMGISRTIYSAVSNGKAIERAMMACGFCCFASYMLVVFSPMPLLSLLGCGLVGLSTGIICPGCICMLSKSFPTGGVPMFGALTLFQYLGNSVINGMIGEVTLYVQDYTPALCQSMFPATDSYELGLRTSLFIVGLLGLVMAVFIVIANNHIRRNDIHR